MKSLKTILLVIAFCSCTQWLKAQVNDHIFPAAAEARKYIDFDSRGFLINGKRTFLVSAGMEYARIPHQLWYDRLLRLKRDGFNCVEIYTFWNFHEPQEGRFDFIGDHDLDAFLKTVKQLGMYCIVRVGPYYCAEWDSGGYPLWLRFKDNMIVRSPNAEFEKYMDRFFDKLIPIVSNNQINKGGSVILVQLENEHPAAWGTNIPNDYFKHLQDKALSLGIKVPYFFSGLHHGSDPAGTKKLSLDEPNRPNPWFSTEFWSVWYNVYGSTQKDADTYGRRTWKIIAHGGNGYNYYMAHGGTNFGYTNNNENAASYDYGAAVGQTGDLRPIYYQFKRNALFARGFEAILENSVATDAYKQLLSDTAIVVTARHSDAGDIVFFDHKSTGDAALPLSVGGLSATLTLGAGEILPVVHNFKLTDDITLNWALTRILGISRQGNTTTMVIYGQTGSPAELQLSARGRPVNVSGSNPVMVNGNEVVVRAAFDANRPLTYAFKAGAETIRIITVNPALADRTWFVADQNRNYVVTGPEYVGAVHTGAHGKVTLDTEHFWAQKELYPTWLFAEGYSKMTGVAKAIAGGYPQSKFTGSWQAKSASVATAVNFDDSHWKKSEKALEMGADGDLTANAWYRATIAVKTAGTYKLEASKGGGRFIVFIDGKKMVSGAINELQFGLTPGRHLMTIYAAHDGRDKLYNFIGNLQDMDTKGLAGEVILHRGPTALVDNWKMVAAADYKENDQLVIPAFDQAAPYQVGRREPGEKRGYLWYQAQVPLTDGRIPRFFTFRGIAEKAVVFIDGKEVARQTQRNKPLIVPYDPVSQNGAVTLSVFVESKAGGGNNRNNVAAGLSRPVEIIYRDDQPVTGWRLQGGPGDMSLAKGWQAMDTAAQFDRPYFFKNTFTVHKGAAQKQPMWRITFDGLSHGFIFINGHNIGGYPERVPIKSLYIPESWLKDGENTVVIYDEYGNRPDKVQIAPEAVASRDQQVVDFK